jgi:hypothetical protein
LLAVARFLAKGEQPPAKHAKAWLPRVWLFHALVLRNMIAHIVRLAGTANVDEFPCQDEQMRGTAADTSGGIASAVACDFLLSGYRPAQI